MQHAAFDTRLRGAVRGPNCGKQWGPSLKPRHAVGKRFQQQSGSVNAVPLNDPALTSGEYLSMIQFRPILGFELSNPFGAAPKPPPNFLENLTTKPVETLTQNPFSGFHAPSLFSILGFLLSNPLISLLVAVALYILVPRIWRALVKWVFIPAGVLGAGIVVVKNPSVFSNAATAIAGFSVDHPYITSAAILGTIGIVLSPYLLTAIVLLLIFTGVPKLPAPLRGFLPAPFLEVEESLRSADQVIRGPVEGFKQQAFKAGGDFTGQGFDFLGKQIQGLPEAPATSETPGSKP